MNSTTSGEVAAAPGLLLLECVLVLGGLLRFRLAARLPRRPTLVSLVDEEAVLELVAERRGQVGDLAVQGRDLVGRSSIASNWAASAGGNFDLGLGRGSCDLTSQREQADAAR